MEEVNHCPVCSGTVFATVATPQRLEEERQIREKFVAQRLIRSAHPNELKDLTDFIHAEKAHLTECASCTLLVRKEHAPPPAQNYSKDDYDPTVMENLFPRYVDAFRKKEKPYRTLLPERARVVEVGSHYGAFLQTATEWGWLAEGADLGKDTSRFAKSKGSTVHTAALEDCSLPASTYDGVFIWNCFDQIEDPKPTLAASRRILKPTGLLTIRTPNGLFYSACQNLLKDPNVEGGAKVFLLRAMGYNNLLGFPYLYGHNAATLERLVEPFGFAPSGVLNSELLVFPLPENPAWVENEEKSISGEVKLLPNSLLANGSGTFTGPWIEARFRIAAVD